MMIAKIKARLIRDWRNAWRFWSLRFAAMGLTAQAVLLGAPDVALEVWKAIPPEFQALLPEGFVNAVPMALAVASMLARLFKQKGLVDA